MTWAKLLALVDGDAGSASVVRTALALGQRLAVRVELLHVEAPSDTAIPITAEAMSAGALSQLIESLHEAGLERAQAAAALHQELCLEAGLPACDPDDAAEPGRFRVAFRRVDGREGDEVARRGRLADVILIGGPVTSQERFFVPGLEAALFETGRPVLLVPRAATVASGEALAVAWDGSREAARAALAALPLISRARQVVVLTADMDWVEARPSELAGLLAEHGVAAKTWGFRPAEGPLGEALLAEAAAAGCDLLVMGAYGHSRLREMVLGGVTRSIIDKAAIPVLMAH